MRGAAYVPCRAAPRPPLPTGRPADKRPASICAGPDAPATTLALRPSPYLSDVQLPRLNQLAGRRRIGRGRVVERAPRILTAVGVERRVAQPEPLPRVIDGELGKRHKVRPVVAAVSRKGAQEITAAPRRGKQMILSSAPQFVQWQSERRDQPQPPVDSALRRTNKTTLPNAHKNSLFAHSRFSTLFFSMKMAESEKNQHSKLHYRFRQCTSMRRTV